MGKIEIGDRFGDFEVVAVLRGSRHEAYRAKYRVRCAAGHERVPDKYWLVNAKSGNVCQRCASSKRAATQAQAKPKRPRVNLAKIYPSEHQCWRNIKARCLRPHHRQYEYYGGRGITIHPEWENNFMAFLDHVGRKPHPSLSLDRIDNDGNYEPGNVRWATYRQQNANQRPPQRKVDFHCRCGYQDTVSGMLWHF